MKQVVVLNTGVANIASVLAAFDRAGTKAVLSSNPDEVHGASHVVLPGVGTFKAGMDKLNETGLSFTLKERVAAGRPLLAVCLGLQLLFTSSEESPDVEGLNIIPGTIKRFQTAPRIPQLGWNLVEPSSGCRLLQQGYAYFANSFCSKEAPSECNPAYTEYGEKFVAAFERGSLLACQFHPELSGRWGQELINRWLKL